MAAPGWPNVGGNSGGGGATGAGAGDVVSGGARISSEKLVTMLRRLKADLLEGTSDEQKLLRSMKDLLK